MKLFNKITQLASDQRYLYFGFVAVLILPNIFLLITEGMDVFANVALITIPAAVYMALLLLSSRPGTTLWIMLPMCVFGAFQLVLLYLFGNSIIAVDMFTNLVTTNSVEVGELLGKLTPAIIGVCLAYIPALILAVHSIKIPNKLSTKLRVKYLKISAFIFVLGSASGLCAWALTATYRPQLHIFPLNVFYNIQLATQNWQRVADYPRTSAEFHFGATSEHPDSLREIYVVVIGETSRAANWSLYGYDRPTNPHLNSMPRLVHFADMITQSNTTHKSVPMLLSLASAENFDILYRSKSMITAFKEAGFRTAFISNHRPNNSFIDYFGNEAHDVHFIKKDKPSTFNSLDYSMLPIMDSIINLGTRKQLIVLHTYGSHFNYQERYSDADRFFLPDNIQTVTPSQRDILINSFDNSIRATDSLLYCVMSRLDTTTAASAMMYISDHGEDIYDDKRGLFLHASPRPTYYQLHIPALMWVSQSYDNEFAHILQTTQNNSGKPMTSNVFFHTVLSLAGINTPYLNDSLSVTSNRFTVTARRYLNDHNTPKPIDKLGLSKGDIEMFRVKKLQFPQQ